MYEKENEFKVDEFSLKLNNLSSILNFRKRKEIEDYIILKRLDTGYSKPFTI